METPRLGMNSHNLGAAGIDDVAEAIESVHWAFTELATAKTLGAQASAYEKLSNAVSDLSSWHPNYDYERGVIWNENDLEDWHLNNGDN